MATRCLNCNGYMKKDSKDVPRCITCEIDADTDKFVKGVLDGIEFERQTLEVGTPGAHGAARRVLTTMAGYELKDGDCRDYEPEFDEIVGAADGSYVLDVSRVLKTVVERLIDAKNDSQAMEGLMLDLDVDDARDRAERAVDLAVRIAVEEGWVR